MNEETAFDYMKNMNESMKRYSCKLDKWLFDTFVNTSSAPRNNRPWFNACIARTLDKVGKGEPIVIGLTGLAGSGKDSSIRYLFDYEGGGYDLRTCHMAFADTLKKIALQFGFTRDQLFDRELKEKVDEFWGISPRQFLQMVGTEMFRKVWRDDVWVQVTKKRIAERAAVEMDIETRFGGPAARGKYRLIFVTDVRFPNEAQMIKDIGGYVVRVERPNNPNQISAKHDSERFVEELPVDLTVVNDCANADEWSWKFAKSLTQFFDRTAFYT